MIGLRVLLPVLIAAGPVHARQALTPARRFFPACLCAALPRTNALLLQSAPQQQTSSSPSASADLQAQINKLNSLLEQAEASGDRLAQGSILSQMAAAYFQAGSPLTAIEYWREAIPIWQDLGRSADQSAALNNIGYAYFQMEQPKQALDPLNQALALRQQSDNHAGLGITLNLLGNAYFALGQTETALGYFKQAVPVDDEASDWQGKAASLGAIGLCYSTLGQLQQAIDSENEALAIEREHKDVTNEASTLNNLGLAYDSLGQFQKALDLETEALPLMRLSGNGRGEGSTLRNLGMVYEDRGQTAKARDLYIQALTLARSLGDTIGQANTLNRLGLLDSELGRQNDAAGEFSGALVLERSSGYRNGEAESVNGLGLVDQRLGKYAVSLDEFNQALPIRREAGDRAGEANTLNNIGVTDSYLAHQDLALDSLNQSLAIFRQLNDPFGQSRALVNMGIAFSASGRPNQALGCFTQALQLTRQTGDLVSQAAILDRLGQFYDGLGQSQKALDYLKQALTMEQESQNLKAEGDTTHNIAVALTSLGDVKGAFDDLQRAFNLEQQTGNIVSEATTLYAIGMAYDRVGRKSSALAAYRQALPILRQAGDREGEAAAMIRIADDVYATGRKSDAMLLIIQVLPITEEVQDPLLTAAALDSMMDYEKASSPRFAILLGKQAVNYYQQVAGNLQGMEKEILRSFTVANSATYRDLASLLIDQGRFAEAERVLDLLKEQEFDNYARGENTASWDELWLTSTEQQAKALLDAALARAAAVSKEWDDLDSKLSRTAAEDAKLKQLAAQRSAAAADLSACYRQLSALFQKPATAPPLSNSAQESAALEDLVRSSPGTAGVYTLVGNGRIREIAITGPGTRTPEQFVIAPEDLNRKIEDLRTALTDPAKDPLPASQALYKIVVGPIEDLLQKSGAHTVLWSLDGVLRYVPIAALNDGSHYMVENYANVVISTRQSNPQPSPALANISGVGFGIYDHEYPSDPGLLRLPNTLNELEAIFRDQQISDSRGLVHGPILINDHFTEAALVEQLRKKPPIVHIASHFVFHAGDDRGSFLLLSGEKEGGLGYELSLAELNSNKGLDFNGTELLTLSACETGLGSPEQDGHEIDGLGIMAQRKGAQAVIASLWEVDDASTAALMGSFYNRYIGGAGKLDKAEALRQAQLELLAGHVLPKPDPDNPSAPKSFTHPHYWAPFILMGNWK